MARIFGELKTAFKTEIMEHDAWSYPKVLEVQFYTTERAAKDACRDYNERNDKPYVPEYYTTMEYRGKTVYPQ